jgi:hypothetical protein
LSLAQLDRPPLDPAPAPAPAGPRPAAAAIAVWPGDARPAGRRCPRWLEAEIDLPAIAEVDAWEAVEDLEADAAACGGVAPWPELRDPERVEAGASRPVTVSAVAVLLLVLAMIHSVGALGSFSLGTAAGGIGRAIAAGVLALLIGIGETVCAVQVTRGRAWARLAVVCLGALMLVWLTMAPWPPGLLTVVVFAAWLLIGALLAHPLTSRFFAALAQAPPPARP